MAHSNYNPLFINNKQLGTSENATGGTMEQEYLKSHVRVQKTPVT